MASLPYNLLDLFMIRTFGRGQMESVGDSYAQIGLQERHSQCRTNISEVVLVDRV